MTLKVRRMLSLIFILLFLIIAPAIILYAAGFKLSKNGLAIQKTGMFIIDSNPRGAKIFINGQVQKKFINILFNKNRFITTPAKIKNLLPGEYDLSLELDGYWGWQKKLTVNPGTSTFVENIYLFKNSLPVQILPANLESINLSAGDNRALILSADQLTFFNLADKTSQTVKQNDFKGKNIAWSADGQKLVIDHYLYNLDDLKVKINLNQAPASFNYKWRDNILYWQDKTSIYQLDSADLPSKIIGNREISDFLIKDRYLYLINQAKTTANLLEVIDMTSREQIKSIGLPTSANYSFINPSHGLLNLYDNNHQILYLINPLADYYSPLTEIINNVRTASWISDSNLLYINDFEIWLYNLETKNKTLLTRISQTINSAVMHPNRNYIIYSTDQTINAIELDEGRGKNTAELVKFDLINSLILNGKGNVLYFSGKIGQTEGLYKLLIQ
ncbi:MAG: hypothetical protein UU95_C0021G0008 [Parcubacteria group bacterium GW2011_GWC2_42_12]|uniref:PEGA domain-containing protein n=2 Tax=Candidatus Falkowiibacteriota TaxID=1752728 RepID=A0A1F5S976_9BACT|nr:MAG: hypothetical protein UU43_C0002G0013 [Candidatus Falkowbacteria bacterium GW2011_GWA2_41_14]KKS33837.1 MAG: hypothetical protein UU95_C0021G0008 [Parcubacteria group bacterium GW2011_GWC2_42_12]OGF23199.1 MAG: hypothetical protein A3D45_01305 [Candidatus Falkowbacteria bacterium RIFCSPHIGHO2_02_FULL_42_9]